VDNSLDWLPVRLARPVGGEQGAGVRVPGYRLGAVLGVGAGGPVWSAVREVDRLAVAVKVVDPAASTEATVLRGLDHPHVVRLLDEVALDDGLVALVLERVSGGSLARVLAARGHLTPGETVTVLTTLGTTFAGLHRQGLTHSDVSPANILFHADGRPMVADLGVARIIDGPDTSPWGSPALGTPASGIAVFGTRGFTDPAVLEGHPSGPAADVFGLAALGWFCLTGAPPPHPVERPPLREVCPTAPPALAETIDAGLDPDRSRRIDAAELAWRTYESAMPEPVTLAGGRDPAAELTRRIRAQAAASPETAATAGSGSRPRSVTVVRATLVASALVTVALTTGLLVTRSAASAAPRWSTVVTRLSASRAAAFADPARGPAAFDAPGSPAWRRDDAALGRLRTSGLKYRHLAITLGPIRVVSETRSRAVLQVAVGTSAYDGVGGPPHREPAVAPRDVRLTLRREAAGWRVAAVEGS
jgi:eukaryotic-like serine/threonine-protein kinase